MIEINMQTMKTFSRNKKQFYEKLAKRLQMSRIILVLYYTLV